MSCYRSESLFLQLDEVQLQGSRVNSRVGLRLRGRPEHVGNDLAERFGGLGQSLCSYQLKDHGLQVLLYARVDYITHDSHCPRPSLALILRAACQEMRRPGSVGRIVKALSDTVIVKRVQCIRRKYAKRLAKRLDGLWAEAIHESIKHTHKRAIVASECRWMNASIADYIERNKLLNPVYAQQQRDAWKPVSEHDESVVAPIVSMPAIAPGLELIFA